MPEIRTYRPRLMSQLARRRAPAYTMGPSGFATNAQGAVDPNDPSVRAALARSAAANPNSTMGPSPNVDYSAAGSGGNNIPGKQPTSYLDDPILAQIRGLSTRNIADAESGALAARQQALVAYGYDPSLSGVYTDPANAAAAQQNPFSTVAQLARNHAVRSRNTDETLNQGNLFYSGTRGQALGDEARTYLGEQAGAQGDLQSKLGAISTSLLAARQAEAERQLQAEQDAYERDLQFREQYGIPGDTSGDTPPPAATTADGTSPHARTTAQLGAFLAAHLPRVGADPAAAALAARSAGLNRRYGLGPSQPYRGRH